MQYNYLALMILSISLPALAQDGTHSNLSKLTENNETVPLATLSTIVVMAEKEEDTASQTVQIKSQNIDTHTLGEALEKVSGVHSGNFGPHSSSPIIRGLSGNRVSIKEDGTNINGLNAISPTTNIMFDPVFSRSINVNKYNDSIESGGHAIGGMINIDSGLVSKSIEDKPQNITVAIKNGTNAPSSQGIKANFNNQDNISLNVLYSSQKQSGYEIPGHSKANVCKTDLIRENEYGLGINTILGASCQVDAEAKYEFNPKSKKYFYTDYIDPNTLEYTETYYDYGLSPADAYTDKKSIFSQVEENPLYEEGQPENTKTFGEIKDITPNYNKELGNSHLDNRRFGISGTYFHDTGYIAATVDRKTSKYGLPGFSMSNLNFSQDYRDNKPVEIDAEQTKYLLQSETDLPYDWMNQVDLDVAHIDERSKELLGDSIANDFRFKTNRAQLVTHHDSSIGNLGDLKGKLGFELSDRKITGQGEQRYLPNVNTEKKAVFLSESFPIEPITFNAGYRFENIEHKIKDSDFRITSRSPNKNGLKNTRFDLNSYELGAKIDVTPNFALKLNYAKSERAPEINELYASQAHYSNMTHEEGNQNLDPEKVASTELSALLNFDMLNITATAYQHDFDGYYTLQHSGTTYLANRLPLKYWKQIDTKVSGFEIDANKDFELSKYGQINTHVFADLVKNKPEDSTKNGEYLNNIPTNRYGVGLNWNYDSWESELNFVHYAQPKYLGKEINTEVALPSYNMMDVSVAKSLDNLSKADVKIFANVSNLLNEEARPHASPLRFIAPLPGRSFNAGVTLEF